MSKLRVPQPTIKGYVECCEMGVFDWTNPKSMNRRGRVQGGGNICPTLCACECEYYVFVGYEET